MIINIDDKLRECGNHRWLWMIGQRKRIKGSLWKTTPTRRDSIPSFLTTGILFQEAILVLKYTFFLNSCPLPFSFFFFFKFSFFPHSILFIASFFQQAAGLIAVHNYSFVEAVIAIFPDLKFDVHKFNFAPSTFIIKLCLIGDYNLSFRELLERKRKQKEIVFGIGSF